MKIYISGPITTVGEKEAAKTFEKAEKELTKQGYEAINPMKLDHSKHAGSWADFMRVDIAALTNCQGVYLLKGWAHSRGAVLEKQIAEALGLFIAYEQ